MILLNLTRLGTNPKSPLSSGRIRYTPRIGPIVCLLVWLVMPALAAAQTQSLLTRHVRTPILNGQAPFVGHLPATQSINLDIVLPLRDQAGLESTLQGLYDPSSPSYRHFLTVQEFTARFGPSQADYDNVMSFAKANGFTVVGGSRDGLDVQVAGSVANIEAAFHVTMAVYKHPTENRTFYAPDREPTVNLPVPLWHISGLDNYSIPHPLVEKTNLTGKSSNATTGSGPSASYLGSDMRAAYYGGTALTGLGQNIGLMEYVGYDIADLNTYYTNAGQTMTATVAGISTDGTSLSCLVGDGCDDTEQILDMTQALGMAPGIDTLYVYVGSSDTAILSAMTTATPLPLQLSSSWTWLPADPSTDDPYFERMAAQGQSYFQASGDSRAWTSGGYTFPADDANVISVGGTSLTTASAGGPWSSETAWIDSGGGISPDQIPIPSWQQLPGVINASNQGSTQYRNGPDVSANADFTFYVCADQATCSANDYGGTSFAAPMWAGYVALANQQAAANGDSPVGFMNPIIYPIGVSSNYNEDFHDITSGNNGYPAVIGYDLDTGWGSPNGVSLINALAPLSTTPTFTIYPATVSVQQGGNSTTTLSTSTAGGFDAAIALTATGQPAGTTVSFSPATIAAPGSGLSTMTVTASSTTPTGMYTITVGGTGAGVTQTTTVSLMVFGAFTPNFSPVPAMYSTPQTVTLTDNSPGVTIYYTTNGSTPTTASTPYTAPIPVSNTTTINAIAAGGGYSPSMVANGTYTFVDATPVFLPGPSYLTYSSPISVTLTDSTPGVTIYYTTNNSTPTTASTLYTGPIPLSATTTINAIAVGGLYGSSVVASGTYTFSAPMAMEPTMSPNPYTYNTAQSVTLADASPGVTIYYTTNGSTPTTASTPYTGPIAVVTSTMIQAIAAGGGFNPSVVAMGGYNILAVAPTMSPNPYTYNTAQSVTLTDSTPGVTIYYTTNGSIPTTASTPYTGPITVSTSTTINAIAAGGNYGPSGVASGSYNITATAPTMSPNPYTYNTAQSVTLTDSTPGVTIYYTTNGSTPTTASTPYTGPIAVSKSTTINAIASGGNYGPSGVASGIYTLMAPTPSFSPSPSAYNTAQSVTLTDSTPGVTIYYTTNGSTPTTASTLYTGPIPVSATTTINAIATGGVGPSTVASGTYTIMAATPSFSPSPATYSAAQSVTLTDSTAGATIYYTTNGSTPTTASTPYTGPIPVSASTTINAIAAGGSYGPSTVASGSYTISTAVPSFSPSPATYYTAQSVTLTDSTAGATIYYTTNGSTPTTASTPYTGPIPVSASTTIKAIAAGGNYGPSAAATGAYTITPAPDLIESSFSVLTTAPVSGGSVSVSDTATNQGLGAASTSTTGFYLSTTTSPTAGTLLKTRIVPSLASGASSGPVTTTITLPTNLSGAYYLIACANYADTVVETNYSNNCTSAAVQVAGADLIESSFSVLTTSVVSGGSVSVSDTATDQGLGLAGTSTTGFYLSTTTSPTAGTLLKTRIVPSLASGASSGPVTTTITLPTNLSGAYYLIACANYADTVVETNYGNNCTAAAVQVAGADLIESSFSVLTTAPVSGGSVSVSDTATDQGLGLAGTSTTGFYLSTTTSPTAGTLLKTRIVPSLASGASSGPVTTTITLPTIHGTYYMIACANYADTDVETSYSNNCTASAPMQVP